MAITLAADGQIDGTSGNDTIEGTAGADTMAGHGGDDSYTVNHADDVVIELADEGHDRVLASVSHTLAANVEMLVLRGTEAIDGTGNALANTIRGNSGANTLSGGAGNDRLNGRAGADIMVGGAGADNVHGGLGADVLTGGDGADNFHFDTRVNGTNVDKIKDFVAADDTFVLAQSIFTEIGAGPLDASAFQLGTAADDAADRIIYDQATGKVYYDADGNGAGAQVLFATVTAGTALTNADFQIVG